MEVENHLFVEENCNARGHGIHFTDCSRECVYIYIKSQNHKWNQNILEVERVPFSELEPINGKLGLINLP